MRALAEYLDAASSPSCGAPAGQGADDLDLLEPLEPAWIVATLGVGYDEEHDRVVVDAHELFEEEEEGARAGEEPPRRACASRASRPPAFVAQRAKELMKGGRPPCPSAAGPWTPPATSARAATAMSCHLSAARCCLTRGSARSTVKGRMPWGSNVTLLAEVTLDGASARAVYKPERGERPLWDFPPDLYKRELAAYLFSEALGWGLVPARPSRARVRTARARSSSSSRPTSSSTTSRCCEDPRHHERLQRICVFDFVANNADRKSGHCLLGPDNLIYGIDNGLTFHVEPKLRTVIWDFAGEPIPDALLDDLRRFVEAGLPDAARRAPRATRAAGRCSRAAPASSATAASRRTAAATATRGRSSSIPVSEVDRLDLSNVVPLPTSQAMVAARWPGEERIRVLRQRPPESPLLDMRVPDHGSGAVRRTAGRRPGPWSATRPSRPDATG